MKMISNQMGMMCIFLAVNCCMIAWTPSEPSVMPSSFIKTRSDQHMMEMFESLNELYKERNQEFNEKFPQEQQKPQIYIMQPKQQVKANEDIPVNIPEEEQKQESSDESPHQSQKTQTQQKTQTKTKTITDQEPQDLYEPQKQAKDIKVREVHEPLFGAGPLPPAAWKAIRQTRDIYAGNGMIQESYNPYHSQLAEELRMNHHFSNFTVEKNAGEKRKMAELSSKDFD